MKKHILLGVMLVVMLFSFALPVSANWTPNITGSSGSIGGGSAGNVWNVGQDGIRFSFVNKTTGVAVTKPVDITDGSLSAYTVYNFQSGGAKNKTYYKNGGSLSLQAGNYKYYDPDTALPRVVGSGADINDVIARFTDKGTIKGIVQKYIYNQGDTLGYSDWTNLYNHLVGGDYKIMIEPIAYFFYNSKFYAMTAAEGARYNTQVSNALHSKMGALTNYALPMAIMLTSSDIFWYDSGVYAQRNNSSFRFSTYYGSYTSGDSAIVSNAVGVGLVTIAPSSYQTILPDLVISSLTADKTSYTAGDTVTVTATVKNQGAATTGSTSYTRLSTTNSGMSASNKSTNTLAAGGTQTLTWTYTAPTVTSVTSITLTAAADYTGLITESNEANNTKTLTVTVNPKVTELPDLVIYSLTANKSSYTAGETITVTAVVKNQGTAATGDYTLTGMVPNHSSLEGSNSYTTALSAGATVTKSWTFTAPAVTSATAVRFTAYADNTNRIAESNENNNTASTAITVNPKVTGQPDLIVSSLTADKSSYTAGETILVSVTVKNRGDDGTGGSSYTRLAATDSSMGASRKATSKLAAGGTQTLTWGYTAPAVTTTTSITLTAAADYTDVITESNESNNAKTLTITVNPQVVVEPDLVISSLTTNKSTYTPGETISITAKVKNNGKSATGSTSSTQLKPDLKAMTAVSKTTSDLAAGSTQTLTWSYAAPTVKAATTVTLTATADYTDVITESNESNNTAACTIMIEPAASLSVDAGEQVYYTNTDVITPAVVTSDRNVLPTDNGVARFNFIDSRGQSSQSMAVDGVVCPASESQLVWVKWRTPAEPQTMTLNVTWTAHGVTAKASARIRIIALSEQTPPDPQISDLRPANFAPAVPAIRNTDTQWSVWQYDGRFSKVTYTASLRGTVAVIPHDNVPTAVGKEMKSGYGIALTGTAEIVTNAPAGAITGPQRGRARFPEFNYVTYDRLLERTQYGNPTVFAFPVNPEAQDQTRIHFTPLWYPDGSYTVYAEYFSAWTPGGELRWAGTDYVTIRGDMFDDWQVTPTALLQSLIPGR